MSLDLSPAEVTQFSISSLRKLQRREAVFNQHIFRTPRRQLKIRCAVFSLRGVLMNYRICVIFVYLSSASRRLPNTI